MVFMMNKELQELAQTYTYPAPFEDIQAEHPDLSIEDQSEVHRLINNRFGVDS